MKDYSNDDRISPAHNVCELLEERGAIVQAFDPSVHSQSSYAVSSIDNAFRGAEALIILARQHELDDLTLAVIKEKMPSNPVLIDTKHQFTKDAAEAQGFAYFAI